MPIEVKHGVPGQDIYGAGFAGGAAEGAARERERRTRIQLARERIEAADRRIQERIAAGDRRQAAQLAAQEMLQERREDAATERLKLRQAGQRGIDELNHQQVMERLEDEYEMREDLFGHKEKLKRNQVYDAIGKVEEQFGTDSEEAEWARRAGLQTLIGVRPKPMADQEDGPSVEDLLKTHVGSDPESGQKFLKVWRNGKWGLQPMEPDRELSEAELAQKREQAQMEFRIKERDSLFDLATEIYEASQANVTERGGGLTFPEAVQKAAEQRRIVNQKLGLTEEVPEIVEEGAEGQPALGHAGEAFNAAADVVSTVAQGAGEIPGLMQAGIAAHAERRGEPVEAVEEAMRMAAQGSQTALKGLMDEGYIEAALRAVRGNR